MGPLARGHDVNFGRFAAVSFSDGLEIRRSDIVPIREFCAAREGNDVGATAAKGLQARFGRSGAMSKGTTSVVSPSG